MGFAVVTFTGYVLLLVLNCVNTATNRRCFPLYDGRSLCFTQPDPPLALSWSDAQQWCSSIGATLPMPHTYNLQTVYSNALGYFGLGDKTMWIGANSTFDIDDWYWTNGTRFTGTIDHGNNTRRTHAQIFRNGTDISIIAVNPMIEYARCICQLSSHYGELSCAHSWNSFWADGKCYQKNTYQQTWSSYTSQCGGIKNLATLDDLDEISRWLDDRKRYWIGLRCTAWSWQDFVSGASFELSDSRFGPNFPNSTSPECLASYSDIHGNVYWMNRNCSTDLQFICQQYVDPTTTTRTTMSSTARKLTTTRTSTTMKTSKTASWTPTTAETSSIPSAPLTAIGYAGIVGGIDTSVPSLFSSLRNDFMTTGSTSDLPAERRTLEEGGITSVTTQFRQSTTLPSDINKSNFDKYGLFILGFAISGGLILAIVVWLATLTSRVHKSYRYSPNDLQKKNIGHIQLTYTNPYEIPPTKEEPSTAEKPFEEVRM